MTSSASSSNKSRITTTIHTKYNPKIKSHVEASLYAKNFTSLKRLHEIKADYESEIRQLYGKASFMNAYHLNTMHLLPESILQLEVGSQKKASKETLWNQQQQNAIQRVAQRTPLREIAFIGRSNVGKSSLISALLKHPKNLVRISKTPGRTQMLNYFRVGGGFVERILKHGGGASLSDANEDSESLFYLVDMPGYGYAHAPKNVVHEWVQMVKDYFLKRSPMNQEQNATTDDTTNSGNDTQTPLRMAYLLIDAQLKELKYSDKQFIQLFHEYQIPYTIVLTKIDKITKDDMSSLMAKILRQLNEEFGVSQETLPLIVPTSSISNRNVDLLRMLSYQSCFLSEKNLPVEYFAKPVPIIHHHDKSKKKAQEAEAEGTQIFKIPRGERAVHTRQFAQKPYVSAPKLVSKTNHRSEKDQKTYIRIMRHHGVFKKKQKKELKKRRKFIY